MNGRRFLGPGTEPPMSDRVRGALIEDILRPNFYCSSLVDFSSLAELTSQTGPPLSSSKTALVSFSRICFMVSRMTRYLRPLPPSSYFPYTIVSARTVTSIYPPHDGNLVQTPSRSAGGTASGAPFSSSFRVDAVHPIEQTLALGS